MGVLQLAEKLPAVAERTDVTVTEVADENPAAEPAERVRSPRHAPGRIERAATGEAPQQMAVRIEYVHEAAARAGDVVVLRAILQRIGDKQIAVEQGDTSPGGIRQRRLALRDVVPQRLVGRSI